MSVFEFDSNAGRYNVKVVKVCWLKPSFYFLEATLGLDGFNDPSDRNSDLKLWLHRFTIVKNKGFFFFSFFYLSSPFVRPYKRIEDNHKLPIIYLISFASEGDLGDSSSSLAFSPSHLRRRPERASRCPHSPAVSHLAGLQRLFVWLGCCQTGGQTALVWSWEKPIDPLQGRRLLLPLLLENLSTRAKRRREQPAGPHIQMPSAAFWVKKEKSN